MDFPPSLDYLGLKGVTIMKIRLSGLWAISLLAASIAGIRAGDWFHEEFWGPLDPSRWTLRTNHTAFNADLDHGELRLSKPQGNPGLLLQAGLAFWGELLGDFDTRIAFRNAQIQWSGKGLGNEVQFWATIGDQDIIIARGDEIHGITVHAFLSPACVITGAQLTNATEGVFRFERQGSQLRCYFNNSLLSVFGCGLGPARVWFDLQNNLSGDAVATTFDDFSATADQIRMPAPSVVRQPRSELGFCGNPLTLEAEAVGPHPISVHWFKGGDPIPGSASTSSHWTDSGINMKCGDYIAPRTFKSSLILTNLGMSDMGIYKAMFSNSWGSTLSSPAVVTVNPVGVSVALYAGVTVRSETGRTFGIQSTTDLSDPDSWRGLTNITLTSPICLWHDMLPAMAPQRFYRVIDGPISIP